MYSAFWLSMIWIIAWIFGFFYNLIDNWIIKIFLMFTAIFLYVSIFYLTRQ
jgi:hypothetical protein